jgi:hypothetical protein
VNLGPSQRGVDPAEHAAQLLFRIGFAILCVALPVATVVSRRAPVIIAPIGILVLISASIMLRAQGEAFARIKRAALSPAGVAGLFLLLWSALSLTWTPFADHGAERLLRVAAVAGIGIGAVVALPERMRASNLYLIAVGVSLAGTVALTMVLARPQNLDAATLERGAILVSLLAWPAVTWLSMKRRTVPAMLIAGGVGALALVFQGASVLPALLVGAVLLGGALNNLQGSVAAFAAAVAVLVLGAPLIAFVLSFVAPQSSGFGRTMQVWADIIIADPLRLLTGHGIETSLRNRISSALDTSAPTSLLFEIWYELGVLGAIALTVAIISSAFAVTRLSRTMGCFALGCMGFALALSIMGLGTSQSWWITSVVVTIVVFCAVANGEYRTDRPQAVKAG